MSGAQKATVEHEFAQQTARLENFIVDAPVVAHIPNSSMDSSRIVFLFSVDQDEKILVVRRR